MTNETKWSPEPWRVFDAKYPGIDADNGEGVVFYSEDRDGGGMGGVRGGFDETTDPAANARRIVACVNACAGIPTVALEAGALDLALATLHLVHECQPDKQAVTEALRALGRLP